MILFGLNVLAPSARLSFFMDSSCELYYSMVLQNSTSTCLKLPIVFSISSPIQFRLFPFMRTILPEFISIFIISYIPFLLHTSLWESIYLTLNPILPVIHYLSSPLFHIHQILNLYFNLST